MILFKDFHSSVESEGNNTVNENAEYMRKAVIGCMSSKNENNLIVVNADYFKGLEKMLNDIAGAVEVNSLDAMQKFIHLREWLNPQKVDKESRRLLNLRWENIHLLLPQEENSPCLNKEETENK